MVIQFLLLLDCRCTASPVCKINVAIFLVQFLPLPLLSPAQFQSSPVPVQPSSSPVQFLPAAIEFGVSVAVYSSKHGLRAGLSTQLG